MRKLIIVLGLLIAGSSVAYATCTTNTIFGPNGRMTICTVCCTSAGCTTTCF
jgi:hypothetical protein